MKPQYRIRNGSEYNAGLKQRGSLTFWLEESVLEQWVVEEVSGKRGASILYSDLAMQTMAPLKTVYRLAGRQCQGFLESIFKLMGIERPVPIAIAMTRLQPEEPKP
jgi:hypothetical protein